MVRLISIVILAAVQGLAQQADALAGGQRALQAGDLARAEQLFRDYLKTNPRSAEALSNLAAVHARRQQYTEAIALYQHALKADPSLTPVHFNLAVSLVQTRQFPAAATHLRLFLKQYPSEARAHQLLGLSLIEMGDFRAAVDELEAAYKLNAQDRSILFSLAYANARAGNEARSLHFLSLTDKRPGIAPLIEGLLDYDQGRFDSARQKFEQVLKEDPDVAPAIAALGRLALLNRDDAVAIEYLERAIKLNPQDSESTYQLGVLYDRTGDTAKGREYLKRALILRPIYADPHYQLGRIALREKEYETALAELEAAKRIIPDQEAIRLLLARTYQALGRAGEAKVEFAEVRRLKQKVVERDRLRLDSDSLMKEEQP